MKWRLREGNGEALYNIGVEDNGVMTGLSDDEMSSSLDTLQDMARRLGATVQVGFWARKKGKSILRRCSEFFVGWGRVRVALAIARNCGAV
jgi:GTPase